MKKSFKLLTILLLTTISTFGQGCSDAGFCTLQNTKEVDDFITKKNDFSIGLGYGAGFENVKVLSSYIQYGHSFNEKISIQAKLTGLNANGSFGNNSGLSDMFLTANYRLTTTNIYDFRFLVGGKLPLGTTNKKGVFDLTLPMDYQTTLGTYDIIFGTSMIYNKNWDFNIAFQIPVSNKNDFYINSGPTLIVSTDRVLQVKSFNRQSDALFRVGYNYKIENSRFTFKPSLLTIYHTNSDTYTDFSNNKIEINGSKGMTVNGVLNGVFTFKNNSELELTVAAPFKVREARPDGLTRKFVLGLQYRIKF